MQPYLEVCGAVVLPAEKEIHPLITGMLKDKIPISYVTSDAGTVHLNPGSQLPL